MRKNFLIFSLSLALIFSLGINFALAQGDTSNPGVGDTSNPGIGDTSNPGSKCNSTICIQNPLKVGDTLSQVMSAFIKQLVLPIGGMLCVIAFIIAGFLYVTAQGNETKIKQAHRALLYAAVGTALVLGAEAFSLVIQNTINSVTTL